MTLSFLTARIGRCAHALSMLAGVCVIVLSGCAAAPVAETTGNNDETQAAPAPAAADAASAAAPPAASSPAPAGSAGLERPVAGEPQPESAPAANSQAPSARASSAAPVAAESTRSVQLFPGSGALINPEPPPGAAADAEAASDGFQLSFVDTEVAVVVSAVLGEGLGLPFQIDPQVKGTLSLASTRPLSPAETLSALESALRTQGIALVNVAGVYQIVPLKEAVRRVTSFRRAGGPGTGPGTVAGGYEILIVPLAYIGVTEMERILKPFAPEGSLLRGDTLRNMLVLAGTSQELKSLKEIIRLFDVDWLAGTSFGIFPLRHVEADQLTRELEELFGDGKSPLAGTVRLVPIPRLNAILVVTPQARHLDQIKTWIERLDTSAATPGRRIYVYDVQYGKADEVAESLNRILGGGGESAELAGSSRTIGTAGGGLGTTPFSGLSSASDTATASLSTGAAPASAAGSFDDLRRGAPRDATASSSRRSDRAGGALGGLRLVPNAENNSLLILASPSEYAVIEAALKQLDVMPLQVLIEASLAEVTLTDDLRYGLQWAYQGGDGPATLSESSTGSVSQAFPGFSYLFTGRTDIRAVLNAIESLTKVRVISAPKLLVLNNREAQLQIGDQVPVTTASAVGTIGNNAPIVNQVQFRDTGVILRVTPRVNKSGLVFLDIAQEVSDVVPTTSSGIDSPTIQQRKIASSVAVRSGETIALGGLMRESRSKSGSGLPFLRRIPAVGDLFGSTSRASRRTELIVILTPKVLESPDASTAALEELSRQFKALRKVPGAFAPAKPKDSKPRAPGP